MKKVMKKALCIKGKNFDIRYVRVYDDDESIAKAIEKFVLGLLKMGYSFPDLIISIDRVEYEEYEEDEYIFNEEDVHAH